jgi:hypothetical protein
VGRNSEESVDLNGSWPPIKLPLPFWRLEVRGGEIVTLNGYFREI